MSSWFSTVFLVISRHNKLTEAAGGLRPNIHSTMSLMIWRLSYLGRGRTKSTRQGLQTRRTLAITTLCKGRVANKMLPII